MSSAVLHHLTTKDAVAGICDSPALVDRNALLIQDDAD